MDRGPGVAGRDPGVQPTSMDPRPGRAGSDPDDGEAWGLIRLPATLAQRFELVRPLSVAEGPGGQADLHLVRQRVDGEQRVLKVYHPGREPNVDILEILSRAPIHPHLIHIEETGMAGSRRYEVMEHVPGGSLSAWLRESRTQAEGRPGPRGPSVPGRGLPVKVIKEVVRQVGDALHALHTNNITHRDVKPANLLLRSRDPLNVAVIDFGISSSTGDGEWYTHTRSASVAYCSPEFVGAGTFLPPNDWWALGITIIELYTGYHPFHGYDEVVVRDHLSSRDIDLSDVTDDRLRLLCSGLLVRDRDDRWGYDKITRWLRGESPEVVDGGHRATPGTWTAPGQASRPGFASGAGSASGSGRTSGPGTTSGRGTEPAPGTQPNIQPVRLFDRDYVDRRHLARDLTARWEQAAYRLFTSPDRAWSRIRGWLAQFDGDDPAAPDSRRRLVERIERTGLPAQAQLLFLVRWLDPDAPPRYLDPNVSITLDALPGIAARAVRSTPGKWRAIIQSLWDHRLLDELEHAPGGHGLADAWLRWAGWHVRWQAGIERLTTGRPDLRAAVETTDQPTVLAALLWITTDPINASAFLRDETQRVRRDLVVPVGWFDALIGPGTEPTDVLTGWLLAGHAVADAARIEEERHEEYTRRQTQLRYEALYEWYREQDRPVAVGWALFAPVLLALGWTCVIVGVDLLPFASPRSVLVAWVLAVLNLIVVGTVEVWLGYVIGGPYHPRFSALGAAVHWGAQAVRPVRRRGVVLLAVLLAAAAVLLALTTWLPAVLPVAVAAGQVVWVRARYRAWLLDRAERERELAQARRERGAATADPAGAR